MHWLSRSTSIGQSICYVQIKLLRALFCRYYFFSRPVVTLLRYYGRFSIDTIFSVDLFLHYYAITNAFLWILFFSRHVTLLRYYGRFSIDTIIFFSRPFVTLLRYYERFTVDTIFSVDLLLRYYAITSAFLWILFFQSTCCYVIMLLRALFCGYYFFSQPAVTLLRYYRRFSLYTIFSVDLSRFSVDKLTCCYVIINFWRYYFFPLT